MARDRSDLRWQHFNGEDQAWLRLRWARETHGGFQSAEAFAGRVSERGHTYRAYERDPEGPSKHIELDFEKAVKWADVLDVRWQWLLQGEGVPWRDEEPKSYSAEAKDAAEAIDRLPPEERRAKVEAIKALLTGTGG